MRFSYSFDTPEDTGGPMRGEGWAEFDSGTTSPALAASLTWIADTPEPWKLYATVAVNAEHLAESVGVTLTIERGLLTTLRRGDSLHIRAEGLWTALSIIRAGRLIAAAGAAGALVGVPLGEVSIRLPHPEDVPLPAPWVGAPARPDVYPSRPVEISVGRAKQAWWWGRPTIGPFDIMIGRGRDREPRLSLERKKVCPETAAHTTAELLDRHRLEITHRRNGRTWSG